MFQKLPNLAKTIEKQNFVFPEFGGFFQSFLEIFQICSRKYNFPILSKVCGFESLAKFSNFGSNFPEFAIINQIFQFWKFVVFRVWWRFPNYYHFFLNLQLKNVIFQFFQVFSFLVNFFWICKNKKIPILSRFVVSIVWWLFPISYNICLNLQ